MKYYLIKSKLNWDDEMALEGFDILTEEELEKTKSTLKQVEETRTCYIGSNEELDISPNEVLDDMEEADEISKEAFMILRNKLGEHFGFTRYNLYFGD
jgi:hypothetical protein